jgi:hypothetical protein
VALLISAVFTLPGFAQSGIPASSVSAIAIDPRNPNTVFAGTMDGIYKTTNGGATWVSVRPNANVFSMAIDPGTPALYVVAAFDWGFPNKSDGVLETTDGATVADFDGDGKFDLAWYNDATGETVVCLMDGLRMSSQASLLTDPNWKVIPR